MRSFALALICFCAVKAESGDTSKEIEKTIEKIRNEIINGVFTARLEMTTLKNSSASITETIEEFHDATTGSHALKHVTSGEELFYYSRLQKPTFVRFRKDEQSCETSDPKNEIFNPSSFFYNTTAGKELSLSLGPSALLYSIPRETFKEDEGEIDIIRGIGTICYTALLKNDQGAFIKLWFPKEIWTQNVLSTRKVPFPLRAMIIRGDKEIVIDFYEMQHMTSEELFRMGSHLQLPFRSSSCKLPSPVNKTAPKLPNRFSFLTEWRANLQSTKLWFDLDAKVTRIEASGIDVIIQDDNHGLIYQMGETCVVKAKEENLPIASLFSVGVLVVEAFRSIKEKYYVGEGTVRGINVDIWEGIGNDLISKARFYVTKSNITLSINNQAEEMIPIRVLLQETTKDDQEKITEDIQIFDYFYSGNELEFRKKFNIEDCQGEATFVEIGFESDKRYNIEEMATSNAAEELSQATLQAIVKTTGLSVLQTPYIKVEIQDERRALATVKLLASPPYLSSFTARDNKYQQLNVKSIDSQTAESCAKNCIDTNCETILYCPGNSFCFAMESRNESTWPPTKTTTAQDCIAYDKAPGVNKDAYKKLDDVVEMIKKKINEGSNDFKTSVRSDEGEFKFLALTFNAYISQFNDRGSRGPYKLEFIKKSLVSTHESNSPISFSVSTIGECYRECIKDVNIACAGFSFCGDRQECVLTSLNINNGTNFDPLQIDALKDDAVQCKVFSVNYLEQFEKLEGKIQNSGTRAQDHAKSAEDCAFRCRQQDHDDLEVCRSFNFCPKLRLCSYFESHYSQEGEAESMEDHDLCDHYALRYSADFTAVSKNLLGGLPTTKVHELTMDDCAKRCIEMSDRQCLSLAYCDGGQSEDEVRTCFLYGSQPEKAESFTTSPHCTLYINTSFVNEIISPSRQSDTIRSVEFIGMSSGGLSFLLIVMIVIGAAMGVAAFKHQDRFWALINRNGSSVRSDQESTIAYSKQEEETPGTS